MMILMPQPRAQAQARRMIKGSDVRQADYPIAPLFLDRWSPRAMSGEAIPQRELMTLFEAARWAPSSYNLQPWRILYAHRDSANWPLYFDLLVESNKAWARNAAVLLVLVSWKLNDKTGQPSRTHSLDTGAAWAFLALQGAAKGFAVHGMQGFDYARAQTDLNIPDDCAVEMMVAIGKPASRESLPPKLQERELPSDRRKLCETAFEGKWIG
jgi:nitroreductase